MKAIINNKEYNVKVIDNDYNETSVEVKILDGTFAGKCAIVLRDDLIKPMKATMEFNSNIEDEYDRQFDDNYHRTLDVTITIVGGTVKTRNDLMYGKIESIVNDWGYDFLRCGSDEQDSTWEQIVIEYEHGNMTAIKKELKLMFKEIKKLFK